jgi:hypothetical protein
MIGRSMGAEVPGPSACELERRIVFFREIVFVCCDVLAIRMPLVCVASIAIVRKKRTEESRFERAVRPITSLLNPTAVSGERGTVSLASYALSVLKRAALSATLRAMELS